ncbi:hypothetical protein Gocc_0624 [Gaiella occulta]|uniref:Peptidase family M23 n=1 Tax=Gaiella occulta TaxID=1002870 RepID=A0A7M2Z266_9ACTN|nr:M23 family metallopeptidase [Gaiella occulta]RDI76205.1 hypothetical protein Gocc_0624 [Gaiella occulta]
MAATLVASAPLHAEPAAAPTPNGPVYGALPGALPPGFAYRYNDTGRGWPVRPTRAQHPIRGSFLDPRGADNDGLGGYHFGVDVNVDDRHPDPGAPPGLSHRVYALESGVVSEPVNDPKRTCGNRRLDIGHFAYWHTSPTVHVGQRVRARQQIGWTCAGEWHVHVSEWQIYRGVRVWVNPLHRGGKLVPLADTLAPVVQELRFRTPPQTPWNPTVDLAQPDSSTALLPSRLHGSIEVRARIGDPQSFLGFLAANPSWAALHHPYRVSIEIRNAASGRVVVRRTSFQSDQLPQAPYLVHYAPGTREYSSVSECVGPPPAPDCSGRYWFRPLSRFRQEFWDTRRGPNGAYVVVVRASDLAGNVGERRQRVVVAN